MCFALHNLLPNSIFRGIEHPGYLGDTVASARKQNHVSSRELSALRRLPGWACVDFLDMFFEDMAIFSTRVGQKIDTTLE
jgi:hypothetical protein